jgi:NADH-quinone oxidoreductase subunit L
MDASIFILIPLLPLLPAVILALGGRRCGEASHRVAIPAVVLSFGLSVVAFVAVLRSGPQTIHLYRLLQSGSLVVDLSLFIDQLAVLLLLLVTGVSSVVHIYSSRYMAGDPRYSRFFAVIAFFTFAMVTLVLSNNLLMTYMCWEAMGICSYLLISHWAERKSACQAATRAFLVNAVADVGLALGVYLTFLTFGTLDIQRILSRTESISGQTINLVGWAGLELPVQTATLIMLLLFMGAMGKSAQVPLHVWLPFAMEAPTPVSALIHAATMVNAGPFLLVRFSPLLVLSPAAMTVIAVIGATTALFAALVSLIQTDIKRLLAYSTISQIGFMILTCGVGAFVAAIFHLLAHGFLKGYLFLSTGNALQSVAAHRSAEAHGPQPGRAGSATIGALVLACLPPLVLFSGPYERLWTVPQFPAARFTFWAIGLTTIFFAAVYLFRGISSLFQPALAFREAGSGRFVAVQPNLFSPSHLLAFAAVGAGLTGLLVWLWSWFAGFLAPAVGRSQVSIQPLGQPSAFSLSLALPLLTAVCGWALACWLQAKPRAPRQERPDWTKTLYVMFHNKWYVDEIYDACVVQPTLGFARWLWRRVEVLAVDRLVIGIAAVSVTFAQWLWRVFDARVIGRMVDGSATSSLRLSQWLWRAIDVRVIDRTVDGSASLSVRLAQWLWRVIDVRGTQGTVERLGPLADDAGHALEEIQPRTLQHHLVVVVCGLGLAIVLLYWLVL